MKVKLNVSEKQTSIKEINIAEHQIYLSTFNWSNLLNSSNGRKFQFTRSRYEGPRKLRADCTKLIFERRSVDMANEGSRQPGLFKQIFDLVLVHWHQKDVRTTSWPFKLITRTTVNVLLGAAVVILFKQIFG